MNFGGTIKPNVRALAAILGVALCILVLGNTRWLRGDGGRPARLGGRSLLEAGLKAAAAGGDAVRGARLAPSRSKGKTREGADDPVTDADVASHCAMVARFAAFPGLKVVSEERASPCPEGAESREAHERPLDDETARALAAIQDEFVDADDLTVWIDPLDATQEYTEKLYEYVTTMVCIAVRGVPIIGIIHRPFKSESAWAWVSKATSSNLRKAHPASELSRAPTVIVSRSHAGEVKKFAETAFGAEYQTKPAGGAGFKVLEVIDGNADVYLHTTFIKKWDICAGNAILNALGGRMTTLKNETIDYSFEGDSMNKDGLVAALRRHNDYVEKTKNEKF